MTKEKIKKSIMRFIKDIVVIAVVGKALGVILKFDVNLVLLYFVHFLNKIIDYIYCNFGEINEDEEDYIRRLDGDYNDERETQRNNI